MALFDRASLVQIPSGYKEGKLYNIKPFNQPFEFERGSAATRVNEDGLIETLHDEATNLLLQSNQFDTTWSSNGITETSGQAGYDGSNDAWLIEKSNPGVRVEQSISGSGVTTFSVYVKAGTLNFAILNLSSFVQYFDLENGVLGNESGFIPAKIDSGIESVGNGWYRCYITTNQSYTIARIYPARANGDNSGSSGNIIIQDAQLESGYFATPYIETTTEAVTRPNRHDTPRLDYSGTEPALLLEPQRTNLLDNFEYDSGSGWAKSSTTTIIKDSQIKDPFGGYNSYRFTTQNLYDNIIKQVVRTVTGDHTATIFIKGVNGVASSGSFIMSRGVGFDIDASGVITTKDPTGYSPATEYHLEYISNGWYKLGFTYSYPSTGSDGFIVASDTAISDFYIYGGQVEAGSYATSYIPTNGQAETRLADVCNGGGNASVFNDSEGTIYYEVAALGDDSTHRFIALSDGTNSNRISLGFKNGSSAVEIISSTGGGFSVYINTTYSIADTYKIALKYSTNNVKLWVNGSQSGSSTTYSAISSLDTLNFDSGGGSSNLYASVKSLYYFPTALTDTELQQLTTI